MGCQSWSKWPYGEYSGPKNVHKILWPQNCHTIFGWLYYQKIENCFLKGTVLNRNLPALKMSYLNMIQHYGEFQGLKTLQFKEI
jgi:hypothetical protein